MYPKVELKNLISINPDSIKGKFSYSEIEYIDISSVGIGQLLSITKINSSDAPGRAKRLVKVGDTILSTVRPNRKSYLFIKETKPNLVISTGFAVLRPKPILNSRFLYQNINLQSFTDFLSNNAKGAAYPAIDVDTVKRASIYFPKLITQQKIASILSAYDDLIENNNKRIKILEGIGKNLFLQLTKVINNNEIELSEILKLKSGYAFKSKDFGKVKTNNIVVRMGNFYPGGGLQFEDNMMFLENNGPQKYLLNNGDLVMVLSDVTRDGRIIGNVGFIPQNDMVNNYYLNQRVSKIETKKENLIFLYELFNSKKFKDYCLSRANSATVLNLSNSHIYSYKVAMPNISELTRFNSSIEPIMKLIQNLIQKNKILKTTKNLLLPKLISGDLDIEGLDIKIRPEIL